jgi:DNA-binding LacI/PurR family transcriptional regulator
MVRAVQDVAQTHRYDTMIANSDHTLNGETHFVESVIRRPVDGVIMVPYHLNDDGLDELIERTGSVVTALGQHLGHSLVDIVFADDGQATHDTVSWLHTVKAHTRIGFIGVTDKFSSAARRRQAYEKALHGVGFEVPAGYEQLGDWSPESGYAAMQKLLALPTRPTAVFACNDLMAIGAMEAAKQEGLRIPEDVAIVGFDDIPAASWVRPRLTTIAQYPTDIGKLLATALFERIEGKYSGPRRRFEVACRFIERDST